ncbi:hypothetical protein [Rhizobium sp. N122]|uniref:hypothetical protein n=1 Tax=Rhizobium sp. N122 TaxID=1764272 RepID=UPI00117A3514|nr:hypothetical protein [Rhizobium sp. N122]
MPSNEADIRNAALEAAAKLIEEGIADSSVRLDPRKHKNLSDWIRDQQAAAIRALKSDAAPVPADKPFTFADPVRQREHEKHKAACGNNVDSAP